MTRSPLRRPAASRHERGLSLIELMIALTLSLLLILGLVEIFSSTRAAFSASEGLARIQENSRFGLDFLKRDLRMAGHLGCLNEFAHVAAPEERFFNHFVNDGAALTTASSAMRIDTPLQVFEFTGSIPGSNYAIASESPAAATAGSAWTPALPADLGLIGGANGIIAGSDVVVVRYFDEAPLTLSLGPTAATEWPVGLGGINQVSGVAYLGPNAPAVVLNAVYGATNCKFASLFQATSLTPITAGTLGGQNRPRTVGFWDAKEVYGKGSMMFRYRAVVYYIGRSSTPPNGPALFRKTLRESPTSSADGVAFAPAEEVVEGVEMMQVLLGASAAPTATGRIDDVASYVSATALLTGAGNETLRSAAMRRVSSVRVSLLMRSPQSRVGIDPVSPTIVVGDVTVTPPADQRLRRVYDSLILMRNRQRA